VKLHIKAAAFQSRSRLPAYPYVGGCHAYASCGLGTCAVALAKREST